MGGLPSLEFATNWKVVYKPLLVQELLLTEVKDEVYLEFVNKVFTGECFGPNNLTSSRVSHLVQMPDYVLLGVIIEVHSFAEGNPIVGEGLLNVRGEFFIHNETREKHGKLGKIDFLATVEFLGVRRIRTLIGLTANGAVDIPSISSSKIKSLLFC